VQVNVDVVPFFLLFYMEVFGCFPVQWFAIKCVACMYSVTGLKLTFTYMAAHEAQTLWHFELGCLKVSRLYGVTF